MALISFREIIDIAIMTAALGYIFMSYVRRPKTELDFFERTSYFNWEDFKFAILITAPGIVLHELMHKFVAVFFGLIATFKAFFMGLAIGILLKIFNSPFILFAPGYVEISNPNPLVPVDPLISAATAFAGPFMNLALYFMAGFILNRKNKLTRNQAVILYMTKQINLFLFIFNMIPIPPLDGSKVFGGIFRAIFG